jgi:uncharacterized protein (DUF2252 family)
VDIDTKATTVIDAVTQATMGQPRHSGNPAGRPRLELDDRRAIGRQARDATPRGRLATWTTPSMRPDPVQLLLGQEASRVEELVPVRHARMAVSAFTFYRGGALVMASDLASQPSTTLTVQLCGDAHLSNFGMFGAPDRSVVFDLNDFDETHPGPFDWDVKRLATSFVLAARDNGLPEKDGRSAAEAAAETYRESMARFARKSELDIWYDRVDEGQLQVAVQGIRDRGKRKATQKTLANRRRELERAVAKARSRDAWSVISKITEVVDGRRRFLDQPPLLARIAMDDAVGAAVNDLYQQYLSTLQDDRRALLTRYEILDMGHKVVGVGSVGLLAFALLLRGRDDNDLMVLQVKQAQASVLEHFTSPSPYIHHGQRVVTGQRLMQAASDSFLGWVDSQSGRDYYVRQLRDMKWAPDPATLDGPALRRYALLCGHTLARAHARSGDSVAIASYLGSSTTFDNAIASFAQAYADQVALDFSAFTAAVEGGQLRAAEDPSGTEGLRGAQRVAAAPSRPKRSSQRRPASD